LIDVDDSNYSVSKLQKWKSDAEKFAREELETPVSRIRKKEPWRLMREALLQLQGKKVRSISGRASYLVEGVRPGTIVVVRTPTRQRPSLLRWSDIEKVWTSRIPVEELTPTRVDLILEDWKFQDSSPLCALIRAMWLSISESK
jgi:hypothetical protein